MLKSDVEMTHLLRQSIPTRTLETIGWYTKSRREKLELIFKILIDDFEVKERQDVIDYFKGLQTRAGKFRQGEEIVAIITELENNITLNPFRPELAGSLIDMINTIKRATSTAGNARKMCEDILSYAIGIYLEVGRERWSMGRIEAYTDGSITYIKELCMILLLLLENKFPELRLDQAPNSIPSLGQSLAEFRAQYQLPPPPPRPSPEEEAKEEAARYEQDKHRFGVPFADQAKEIRRRVKYSNGGHTKHRRRGQNCDGRFCSSKKKRKGHRGRAHKRRAHKRIITEKQNKKHNITKHRKKI